MKHFLARMLLCLFAALLLFASAPAAHAASDSASETPLRFQEDGTFTIMLLSDTQDTQFPPAYLARSIEAVLNNYHVDLVVLLGDQLEGGSPLLHIGIGRSNVEQALGHILTPLEEAGVPFAFVFGNHDYEAPLPVEQQEDIYRSYANCVSPEPDASGAYRLPVHAFSDDTTLLNLYFFQSGPSDANGGYGAVSADQVAWYKATAENLYTENGNQTIPAVAFQHVIVQEVYELFNEVPKGTPNAVVSEGGISYLPSEEDILLGSVGEAPCPSEQNNGLFDAFVEQGDVFVAMAGHDHVNSFIGRVRGVDVGTAPGSSFTSYGDADVRGVRLLRFNETDVKSYDTIHVLYSDYTKIDGIAAVRYYLTTTTRIPNLAKAVVLALLILTLIVLLIVWIKRSHRCPASDPDTDPGYDDPPDRTNC